MGLDITCSLYYKSATVRSNVHEYISIILDTTPPIFFSCSIQALFFGGEEKMPSFLARHTILELGGVVIDPCAAILVIIVTVLLYLWIKEVSASHT